MLLLLLSLLADPGSTAGEIQVVVLGLESTELDKGKVALVDGFIAETMSRQPRLKVLTRSDIERLAAFQADKALIGCAADTCMAEIANALGVAYVVFGRIGTLDDLYVVQLNLFDAGKGEPIGRQEARATSLRELDGRVQPAVVRLLSPLTGVTPPAGDAAPAVAAGPSALAVAGFVGAGVLAVTGGVLGGFGLAQVPVVEDKDRSASERQGAKDLGAALVVGGGAALTLALVSGVVGAVGMVLE
jgi:TolB-like protein